MLLVDPWGWWWSIHGTCGFGEGREKLPLGISASVRGGNVHFLWLQTLHKITHTKLFCGLFSLEPKWCQSQCALRWYPVYDTCLSSPFLLLFKMIPVNLECTTRCRKARAKNLNAHFVSTFTSCCCWVSSPSHLTFFSTPAPTAHLLRSSFLRLSRLIWAERKEHKW